MKLPRRAIPASGRGRCRAPGRVAHARGRKPIRRGRCVGSLAFTAGGGSDITRAADGTMAVGAARSAIRHREPAGSRHQYRHRGGRACAAGRLYASPVSASSAINATLYDKLNFNFIRDIAPVASIVRSTYVMVVNPSVPAKTVPEFIAYAKANPGKINMASAGNRDAPASIRRAVQDDGRRQHDSRALSRRGARSDRPARRTGTTYVRRHWSASIEYIRTGKLRALAVTTCNALGGAAGYPDAWAILCRATRPAGGRALARPKNTPTEIIEKLNKEINAALADPKMKARLADLGGTVLAGLTQPTSGSSSPTKPRSGAR